MVSFLKSLEFGPRILLLLSLSAVCNFFLLGYLTREIPWSNVGVVTFLLGHSGLLVIAIIVGVKLTTAHALLVIEHARWAEKQSYDAILNTLRRQPDADATRPASTPGEELGYASTLLKNDAKQWREEQGLPLSGLPHRDEEAPQPALFVDSEEHDDPDHEGPGDEDGPWFEGVHPDPGEPAEEQDPSTADGPFASGTRQNGPLGERTW